MNYTAEFISSQHYNRRSRSSLKTTAVWLRAEEIQYLLVADKLTEYFTFRGQ